MGVSKVNYSLRFDSDVPGGETAHIKKELNGNKSNSRNLTDTELDDLFDDSGDFGDFGTTGETMLGTWWTNMVDTEPVADSASERHDAAVERLRQRFASVKTRAT